MLTRLRLTVIVVFVLSLFLTSPAGAVPHEMNYQGKVVGAGGILLDGIYDMKFSIYNDPNDGNRLWNEQQSVPITDGVFNVSLGAVVPLSEATFAASFLGLEIEIYNPVSVAWEILSPRQRLTSTAYSFQAENAQTIGGYGSAYFAPAGHEHSGEDTTSGTIDEARIDPDIARDSEITWMNLKNIPADLADGDDGITAETDPTITEPSIKDGVSWGEIGGIPAGFADGVDDTGATSETDPKVGNLTRLYIPTWNGNQLEDSSIYHAFFLNEGYRVGLGTDNPQGILHVSAGTLGDAKFILEADTDNNNENDQPSIEFRQDGGTVRANVGFDSTSPGGNDLKLWASSSANDVGMRFLTGSTPIQRMRITAGGQVHVGPDDTKFLSMFADGALVDIASYGSALAINYSGDNNTLINFNGGRVGIGPSLPTSKLYVKTTAEEPGIEAWTSSPNIWHNAIFGGNTGQGSGVYGSTSSTLTTEAGVYATNGGAGPGIIATAGSEGYAGKFEGMVSVDVLEIKGADLSEQYNVRNTYNSMLATAGQVVSIDPENPGDLLVSHEAYDRKVAGIISGAGDISIGMLMGKEGHGPDGKNPVALTGRVYCLADTSNGAIAPGDLLTTSNTPGHAMKVSDYERAQGAILGKAMSSLGGEKGMVLVLVTLQ